MGGKSKAAKHLQRDVDRAQKMIKKVAHTVETEATSNKTVKSVEKALVPCTILSIFTVGLLNVGQALSGNAAAGLVALQSLFLAFVVAIIEYDRAEYHRKSKLKYGPTGNWGVITHGLTVSLVGEHRARRLIKNPVDYSKVLMLAAVESLAFGWAGVVSMLVVLARTALLLRK